MRSHLLPDDLLHRRRDLVTLAIRKEILSELLTAQRTLAELPVQLRQNVAKVSVRDRLYLIENLLVSLLWNHALLRVSATARRTEQLFKYVFQIELPTPAKILRKRKRHTVSVVHL